LIGGGVVMVLARVVLGLLAGAVGWKLDGFGDGWEAGFGCCYGGWGSGGDMVAFVLLGVR